MPNVNGKKFSYTKAGVAAAKKEAKKTGKKMKGVKHYLPNGTEWPGATHKMPSGLFTGKLHTPSSKKLVHYKDIKAKKK